MSNNLTFKELIKMHHIRGDIDMILCGANFAAFVYGLLSGSYIIMMMNIVVMVLSYHSGRKKQAEFMFFVAQNFDPSPDGTTIVPK